MPSRIATHKTAIPGPTKRETYDRYARDRESYEFYKSPAWRRLRAMKIRQSPLCERCLKSGRYVNAAIVHHVIELRADWSLAFEWDNLESLCSPCHTSHHKRGE